MTNLEADVAVERWWSWPRDPYRRGMLLQLGVWLAAAALCAGMMWHRSASVGLVGLARGSIAHLSVPFPARVKTVSVELYQSVQRGQVVALLDDEVLQGQIASIEAEIDRLRAEHAENQGLLDSDVQSRIARWDADSRAFDNDAVQLEVALREVRVDLEYDRAMHEGLRANVERLDRLVRRGHAPPSDLELVKAEFGATGQRVIENERLLASLEAKQQAAKARSAEYAEQRPLRPPVADSREHLTAAIAVQQGLLRELEGLRAQCILRAPFDGIVIEIQASAADATHQRAGEGGIRQPGEVVDTGDPVVIIAAARPTEIVAYAPDGRGSRLSSGQDVLVVTMSAPSQIVESKIASIGPTVELLPQRLWQQQIPAWGRPFVIPIPGDTALTVGDRVNVRIR
jgi:multidrug resistance efflux pump